MGRQISFFWFLVKGGLLGKNYAAEIYSNEYPDKVKIKTGAGNDFIKGGAGNDSLATWFQKNATITGGEKIILNDVDRDDCFNINGTI